MKYLKKACINKKVVVALNGDKEKYLNYETSINEYLIGNACIRCHYSERLNSFEVPKNFNNQNGGFFLNPSSKW